MDLTLAAQRDRIAQLQEQSSINLRKADKLRDQLRFLRDQLDREQAAGRSRLDDLMAAKDSAELERKQLFMQRDRLTEELHASTQSFEAMQAELTSLRAERDKALLRIASLKTQFEELAAIDQDQKLRLASRDQYLSSDRDIRELMGARNLYIADVFDVDGSSHTRKPFGRIFYTRGKSLIFYAYDLDRQPKAKEAAAFQVWGEKETTHTEQPRPLNLGILYLDSESNRRWILRFDDPRMLAEIDAVFVTIEPRGGSSKPTGKPFLFAMLRKEANHP
jgi:hypothetical protein